MSKMLESTNPGSASIDGPRVREPIVVEDVRPPGERARIRKLGEKMIEKYDVALRELAKK